MDAHLVLSSRQEDIFARWQLLGADWTNDMVRHRATDEAWRTVHSGVYTRCHGPLTQRQLWIAAVLTAPGSFLAGFSATALHGYWSGDGDHETVVRAGSGGPRRYPGLLVLRSSTLDGATDKKAGIPVVSAERALVDVAADLSRIGQLGKAFREASRLKCLDAHSLGRALRGQRGTAALAALCERYATIPYYRCRSDAEARGLEILWDAGFVLPRVNWKLRGPRPDFWWPQVRFIIEIDGDQYHQFPDEDARKQALWEGAGNTVARIDSQDVYYRPERLIALADRANVPKRGS